MSPQIGPSSGVGTAVLRGVFHVEHFGGVDRKERAIGQPGRWSNVCEVDHGVGHWFHVELGG